MMPQKAKSTNPNPQSGDHDSVSKLGEQIGTDTKNIAEKMAKSFTALSTEESEQAKQEQSLSETEANAVAQSVQKMSEAEQQYYAQEQNQESPEPQKPVKQSSKQQK